MELVERVERAEAEMLWGLASTPAAVRESLGITGERFGAGMAIAVRNDPAKYWSKAHGFGFDRPVDAELVGSLLEFYRSAADVANLHFAPSVLPADWDAICGSFGLTAGTTLVKTVREAGPVEPVETSLRIGPIELSEADAWGAVQIEAFELPDPTGGFASMLASFAALPEATAYGAWDGDKLVATGGLFSWNGVGECVSGSTLPAYRGRGAQTALLARRIEDAFAAGCEWATSETGKPAPGQHNASLANMERVGFKVLYDRTSYRWTA